jgi:hypothetical protein
VHDHVIGTIIVLLGLVGEGKDRETPDLFGLNGG